MYVVVYTGDVSACLSDEIFMSLPFSGPLYDCAEGEMKCSTRESFLVPTADKRFAKFERISTGRFHGWPCIPKQEYYDGNDVHCLDVSDEST